MRRCTSGIDDEMHKDLQILTTSKEESLDDQKHSNIIEVTKCVIIKIYTQALHICNRTMYGSPPISIRNEDHWGASN